MTKTQERRVNARVLSEAVSLIVAESQLMETPLTRSQVRNSRCFGKVLDAAHETVHELVKELAKPRFVEVVPDPERMIVALSRIENQSAVEAPVTVKEAQ